MKPEIYAQPEFSHNCAQGPKMLVQCVLRAVGNPGGIARSGVIAARPSTSPLGDPGSEPEVIAASGQIAEIYCLFPIGIPKINRHADAGNSGIVSIQDGFAFVQ